MNRICRIALCFLLACSVSSTFLGCSGKKIEDADPADLYKMAEDDITNDQYLLALEKLKMVRNKFPYSKYAVQAQLRIADVYYAQESFTEAAAAYESFSDLHPKHEKVSYALYRMAEAYFNDIPSPIARDLTPAKKAEDAYNEFLKRFPGDPQSPLVRTHLEQARNLQAEKELYIANFYFKQDQFDSAKRRYEKLLLNYPESKHAGIAREKLALVEKKIQETPPAKNP